MRLSEIESPGQNISTHPSLEPRVPRIAIVGAGFVGSTTAFALMMSGMAAEIVVIGRNSSRDAQSLRAEDARSVCRSRSEEISRACFRQYRSSKQTDSRA